MSMTRRNFLLSTGWAAVAGAAVPATGLSADPATTTFKPDDWRSVRTQFNLSPDYVHLAGFYIVSHPRPVREAIERYRKAIDENPFLTVDRGMFGKPEDRMATRVCEAAAAYSGGKAGEYAITPNTTTGLALIYNGLMIRHGQEILTSEHDHYSHHESIRLATQKNGASWRRIALFEQSSTATEDEIVGRLIEAIQPNTRVIGVTWVHSSSGIRLPVRKIADAIREINRKRDEPDRILLVVDGVHGYGAVDEALPDLGCDFFAAGTHKWILAPRGTGIVWARDYVWAQIRPTVPSFISPDPYEAWLKGDAPRGPTQADWVSPGGFFAYEYQWAMADAFHFQKQIGRRRAAERIAELNGLCKEGLVKIPHVTLHTPPDGRLSAGIICFEIAGLTAQAVVDKLLRRDIIASASPYAKSYARVSFSIMNSHEEVEVALRAIHDLV
ncbi:aminotransferase class V-fold PLP-dependent enzyme [Nitrosovibrio sp. Nv4]|uniref:aminotransferase class V-fold PLP-dependent enzyme n=1 Tax=Nitrosovibrio sp. Nv4 TaxID=1945880 RepID=UPI000BCBB2D6|nr:aminotransferase class V-fold PLP-dependent enzyme [Nitrosovibrio sp. Nv4]SOD41161.1 Selenocysteine lyase/Cysteine desulfurase [Nitrosovibrio sp. Nv4]